MPQYSAFCLHLDPAEYGLFPSIDVFIPKRDIVMNAVHEKSWIEIDCAFLLSTMAARMDPDEGVVFYGLNDYWGLKMHRAMRPVTFSPEANAAFVPKKRAITITPSRGLIRPHPVIVKPKPTALIIETEV